MTNPKIEKVKANIAKTKATIENYQAKLRELEKLKIQLENDEVVALFRREKFNEDEFAALLRSQRKDDCADYDPSVYLFDAQSQPNTLSARKEESASDPI